MNTVLLTIDDVPSRNTPVIVDELCARNITAIMFAVGMNVERFYDEAVYAVRKGMIVGNHSYSHAAFSAITFEACIAEIEKCEAILERVYQDAGVERKHRPFRFPYGDKGGANKAALQNYLAQKRFDKVEDRHLPYKWWRENRLDRDIDTLWTFDCEEYRTQNDETFTRDSVWEKMNDANPKLGAALYGENQRHILLMHAFDETEAVWPGYCRELLDELQRRGVTFDPPAFIRIP
jgi:peptidoglycan/xylan/chitin deacetylase (PgdA/CDA1 family)